MNLFDKILGREVTGLPLSGEGGAKAAGGTNWLEQIVHAGNERTSLNVAAVWRCVNLISDAVAVMPLRYKVLNKAGYYEVKNKYDANRMNYLLNVRPNWRMNGYTLKKTLVMQMLLKGNAFVLPVDARGKSVDYMTQNIDHLVLLTDQPAYDRAKNTYSVSDLNQGVPMQEVRADRIWHFKNATTDGGFWGESTVGHAMNTLSTLATADKQALKNVSTGGRIKAILSGVGASQSIGTANKKQMSNAALDVEDALAAHDIVTLPDKNLELKPLSLSAAETQFVQSREFGVLDVCRWFSVPPYKLGIGNSNYKAPDAAQVDFYTEAVQPICSQIENELWAKTTGPDDYMAFKYDWDERPLFTLDMTAKAAWNKSRLETGLATVNEMRIENDIEPVKNGDEVLLSANLKSVTALTNEGAEQTKQEPIENS